MAPDLNSVPVSPRPNNASSTQPPSGQPSSRRTSMSASRRASQIHPMSPPPLPLASPGGTLPPSLSSAGPHTHAFPPLSPSLSTTDPATAPPMRHPRPMTAAEMHLELEKEQEAVVNRLTRELSALRAHSASVASTTSSVASSANVNTGVGHGDVGAGLEGSGSGAGVYGGQVHGRQRHRSSSSVSRSGGGLNTTHSQSQSHRQSISSQVSQSQSQSHGQVPGVGSVEMRRSSSIVSTPRYEEVAQQRAELAAAQRENEALKQRIRELERAIRGGEEGRRGRRGAPDHAGVAVSDSPASAPAPAPATITTVDSTAEGEAQT